MKEKQWKKGNLCLITAILIGTIITMIFYYIPSHLATYLVSIIVVLIPQLLNRTKFLISEKEKFIYYCFLFFAYFLGSVVNLYNTVWWYDILMHFISGLVVAILASSLLKSLSKEKNKGIRIIFCVSFAIAIAGIWEIAEFAMDQITGSNLQHSIETGVEDTMQDIICGSLGAILYALINIKMIKKEKNDIKY